MIHASHLAAHAAIVPHAAVTHVVHGQQRTPVEVGHRRAQPVAHGQRAGGVAGAVHRLREDREGILARRLDDDVEGLGHRDPELVH